MTDSTAAPLAPLPLVPSAPPQSLAAQKAADALYESAETMEIDCPLMYEAAGRDLVSIRTRWKLVEEQRVHMKEPFLEGCRRIDAFFKTPLDRLAAAGELLKKRMVVFKDAEDAKVEAARVAEEERLRAERAELQRQQDEAAEAARQVRVEAERVERERLAAVAAAEKKAADDAAAARAAGDEAAAEAAEAAAAETARLAAIDAEAARVAAQEAETIALQAAEDAQVAMDLADVAPAAVAVVSGAVASGISGRKTWKLKSVDKAALVIAAGKAAEAGDLTLLEYLDVNESTLNGIAKALKGAAKVAGCLFHQVSSISARSR